jgi:nucleoside-triphosphatase
MSIVLFSRPIRSGKTSELQAWIAQRNGVGGVLMPDVDAVRMIKDIRSSRSLQAQFSKSDYTEDLMLKIGSFIFSKAAFDFGKLAIAKELEMFPEVLIIDEVGKLELKCLGFYNEVEQAVSLYANTSDDATLILVVRQDLLTQVIDQFKLKDFRVVESLVELN